MDEQQKDKQNRIGELERLALKQQQQIEELKALLLQKQEPSNGGIPLPKPPKPVAAPTTLRYEFWRKFQDPNSNNGDPWSKWNVDLPNDPRICVYCRADVAKEYQYDIGAEPTAQQAIELKRLHAMHKEKWEGKAESKNMNERRNAAQHKEVEYKLIGPTPNIVARFGGREFTAEEYNAWMLEQHEHKIQNMLTYR